MRTTHLLLCFVFVFSLPGVQAQDSSLLKMLDDSMAINPKKTYVMGTFKAEHIVNMQTVEAPGRGAMTFIIEHRFGRLNKGAYEFFGLDEAYIRLQLNFGITDRLSAGISRTSYEKTFEGYVKYKLLRQTDDERMPLTVSAMGSINYNTYKYSSLSLTGRERTSYVAQLLMARKFSRILSLQLVPTYLRYNYAPTTSDKKDQFAAGAGGRIKITKRMSINAEYHYLLPNQAVSYTADNSFSLGWDIETGGHVFQLVFSNSPTMIESQFIGKTNGSWGKGDINFGFNVSRNFNISKKAKKNAGW